jgi:hypothetical protein
VSADEPDLILWSCSACGVDATSTATPDNDMPMPTGWTSESDWSRPLCAQCSAKAAG